MLEKVRSGRAGLATGMSVNLLKTQTQHAS